ncbi:MAG TPA: hypothetical protein VFT74_00840, partial [Isosphaeraceae bacterium]|nr:hypothetical protein [Isosphaeraceae bacterium]
LEPILREVWEEQRGADLTPDLRMHEQAISEAEGAITRLMSNFGNATEPAVMRALRTEVDRLTVSIQEHRDCIQELEARMGEVVPWETVVELVAFVREQREKLEKHPDPPFNIKRQILESGGFRVFAKGRELKLESVLVSEGSSS